MGGENCWEYRKCGRELGGNHTAKKGVCPVAAFKQANGLWGGINGGRVCCRISKALDLDNDESRRLSLLDKAIDKNANRCEGCNFYEILNDESIEEIIPTKFEKYILSDKKSALV
ncbi:MAG: hypothetical protein WCR55_07470 [Lentisphaerota bacterium]